MTKKNPNIGLTPDQQAAVESSATGRLKIIAGAGSGKTEVLTRRVAALLASGISPNELVAVTYTNKAAAAMKDRLIVKQGLSPALLQELTITTFHSFLARVLKSDPFGAGIDISTSILTENARWLLLSQISTRFGETHAEALFEGPEALGGEMSLRLLEAFPKALGKIRRYLLSPREFFEEARHLAPASDIFHERVCNWMFRFHSYYLQVLEERRLIDFDDILLKGRETIAARKQQHDPMQQRVFLIDEFQDNNRDQFGIVQLFLDRPDAHLTVVGDPRQSIYRFQGADVATFNEFQADRLITLSENFRSYAEILSVADQFIAGDVSILAAGTQHARAGASPRPCPVALLVAPDDDVACEAGHIAETIHQLVHDRFRRSMKPVPFNFGDIAVIVDSIKHLPREFEDALLLHDIPYVLSGGLGFYDRGEIMEIVSFLRLVVNPRDDRSLVNILSGPLFGISDAELAGLSLAGRTERVSLAEHLERLPESALPERAHELRLLLMRLRDRRSSARLLDLVYYLLDEAGFRECAARQPHPLRRRRMENNLAKFVDIVRAFESNGLFTTLRDFLQYLDEFLGSEADESEAGLGLEEGDAIKVLTIHKAKGLEFPVVFLPFLKSRLFRKNELLTFTRENGLLLSKDEQHKPRSDPRLTAHHDAERIACRGEERRKWYVALTRPEELLIISGRQSRLENPEEPLCEIASIILKDETVGKVLPIERVGEILDVWRNNDAGEFSPATSEAAPLVQLCSGREEATTEVQVEGKAESEVKDHAEIPAEAEGNVEIHADIEIEAEGNAVITAEIKAEIMALEAFLGTPSDNRLIETPEVREDVFSLADLTQFSRCPRRFFYTRRHVTPFVDAGKPLTFRTAGTLVHHALRLYHATPVAHLSPEVRKERMSELLDRLFPLLGEDDDKVKQRAEKILAQYMTSQPACRDAWLLEAEVNLRFHAPSGSFLLRGFADRVDQDGPQITVIDYKTRPFSQDAHESYARQMALYLTAAQRGILGHPGQLNFARIELVYLTPSEVRIESSEPDLVAFEHWATGLVEQIRCEKFFSSASPETCGQCPFAVLCCRSSSISPSSLSVSPPPPSSSSSPISREDHPLDEDAQSLFETEILREDEFDQEEYDRFF
ncbi:MAG: ATP-dependent DNA helicase [Candidatus Ozemobacteraceae bacterium]